MNSASSYSKVASGEPTKDHFLLTHQPLSLEKVYTLADDAANGAVVIMSGTVRNKTAGQPVSYLDYQAYEPMVLEVFRKISRDIRQKFTEINHVVIHHRLGALKIGEISVLVAVGCPHRQEAFAGCRYAIDTLKYQAPIWKKEYWQDGSSSWVNSGSMPK